MTLSCYDMFCVNFSKTLCSEPGGPPANMQISEAAGGVPQPGTEPCRFPKLEECAHFHYERVQLPDAMQVALQTSMDQSLHSQHTYEEEDPEWFMVQVTSGEECWLVQRNFENFKLLDEQLHQCIFDRKISHLPDLSRMPDNQEFLEEKLSYYLERFSQIANNSVNCGPVLNWLQMDNKGHRLLVPSEESRSINTPAVAAAYSVRRYVSQARDELNLEVGDMISVIDMASPGESMWWRGKRGFQVGFFPQHCVHIIGDKVPRNMPLPPPVVGSLALSPVKPVLRKHGKLITFFRSFILNRPSRRRLKQSGILKERVFGCDLGEHLLNTGKDVPTVLRSCAEFIENRGIVDGIYRLSGITSNNQKLRNAFDEDRVPDLYTEDILKDIHSVASLLKMYFRELPNPLCTYQLYQSFVNAVQGCSTAVRNTDTDHERLLKMREAVQKLPPPHYRTLEYLMRHLTKVAAESGSTGMTTRNLAIVWAPNLLRCEALEVGGVAALQGVGVQAVVTEFLICYADLIFCDRLPNIDLPELAEKENLLAKKCRPNSLNISTPTKLITLEEARNKHLMNRAEEYSYIEVGGGPSNLPKKYHTIIELPPGARKRGHTKRSPLGWRMFFTRSARNTAQGVVAKTRKISNPITINDKSVTESDLTDMRRKLRSVKSAESLTSGHSEPASTEDVLGPLHSLIKPPGHNRSVSHDSYFDTLQSSQNNSEGSLLDLSEIHLNFDLEESEMRIFSEDESLVSSPRIQKDTQKRILTRVRPEDFASTTNSVNPSPKKQARLVLSPESMSRKRTRLEDQLSDIQFIDCSTPENTVSTTAVIHAVPVSPEDGGFSEPKNKSPRNSENPDNKRQSLNLECSSTTSPHSLTKSFTDLDLRGQFLIGNSILTSPTPTSPGYKQLGDSSGNTSPGFSPNGESSPSEIKYQFLKKIEGDSPVKQPSSPNYENILTTISITYKSPPRSATVSPMKSPVYEDVSLNAEKGDIPTSTASLPIQEASQPDISDIPEYLSVQNPSADRPKSLSALEDNFSSTDSTLKANSSCAVCNTSEPLSLTLSLNDQRTVSSNQSSGSNIQYTASLSSAPYHFMEGSERLSQTDLSLSEVVPISSTENLATSQTSISTPISPSRNSFSPNVSPTTADSRDLSSENLLSKDVDVWSSALKPTSVNLIDFSPQEPPNSPNRSTSQNDKRKSDETESYDDNAIYQQVKYFRRSIHEVNALLDLEALGRTPGNSNSAEHRPPSKEETDFDSLEKDDGHIYENLDGETLRSGSKPHKTDCNELETEVLETCNVKDLKNIFEEKSAKLESPVRCNNFQAPKECPKSQNLPENDRSLSEIDGSLCLNSETVPRSRIPRSLNDDKTSTSDSIKMDSANSIRLKKFYEKDGLPPCVRARNLKLQQKTRSLDENEFEKEFGVASTNPRRKSFDERIGYNTNSLPKVLNQPKLLPKDENGQMETLHLSHSNEKINLMGLSKECVEEEEQKKRERIEKYKEERRRILSERYRSESFKEDKDVLLSRLKIYKGKEEPIDDLISVDSDRPPRSRRKCTKSESESVNESRIAEERTRVTSSPGKSSPALNASPSPARSLSSLTTTPSREPRDGMRREDQRPPMGNSLKVRAAIFEQQNQKSIPVTVELGRSNRGPVKGDKSRFSRGSIEREKGERIFGDKSGIIIPTDDIPSDLNDLDFIRHKRRDEESMKEERRRHTYETRDRETDAERLRRVSLESKSSPRKEKMSPTYCIKDMKAIFESKSKQ
ncbi:GTPase-activating protein CdGAPr isoform X2 [Euwallacea similis]|uniref:GTPase-activating protein CdGAPr isoform X2 n=1 Tax=Euwallacea similis TaxID=1736056 RepID=UPI00344C5303